MYPTGETATSAFFLWVLKGADGPIIVDTGFTHRLARHRKFVLDGYRTRDELLEERRGVDAPRVSNVILTHLHWDHFDVEGIFPRAVFSVQREELEFWTGYGARERWHQHLLSDCFAEDLLRAAAERPPAHHRRYDRRRGRRVRGAGRGAFAGMQIVAVRSARGRS